MPIPSRENPEIRAFLLEQVASHPRDLAATACKKFNLSRPTIVGYINRLARDKLIEIQGNTSARTYKIRIIKKFVDKIRLTVGLSEDAIWRFKLLPLMSHVSSNILDICDYGFTEMLNNAIDHSASYYAWIYYEETPLSIKISVIDEGIGIFEKIQRHFNLSDPRDSILELSKGKLTSDPKRHTGEGVFFTSRMFDEFTISSGNLFFSRSRKGDHDWLIETHDILKPRIGTNVNMTIGLSADWTKAEIFDKYHDDNQRFRRTHVPIKLGLYPGESLVSRSQAKRILTRFERFSEVMLDFSGVDDIGQGFADEIFRIYKNDHPDIRLIPINVSPAIERMIQRASKSDGDQPELPFI
jgi:anti-sigma regulatory factor (Ser/Thr protein kinase)